LPFLAEALFIFSGGRITHHYIFFQFAGSTALNIQETLGGSGGVGRLQTGSLAGESLMLLGLAYLVPRKKYLLLCVFFLVGIGLISMSGHRMGFVRAFCISWLYFALVYRKKIVSYCVISGFIFLGLIGLFYLLAPHLPLSAQRMVSVLPGIDIDPVAKLSAYSTSQWRITMWFDALQEIPEYLIIGKGYTFPGDTQFHLDLEGLTESVRRWGIETSAYHNGIFSLLIGMGLSGLLIGTFFLLSLVYRYYKICRENWEDPILEGIFYTVFCVLTITIIFFFTLYGDVHVSFPQIMYFSMILEGVAYARKKFSPSGFLEKTETNTN
jgi:hypothetical protein